MIILVKITKSLGLIIIFLVSLGLVKSYNITDEFSYLTPSFFPFVPPYIKFQPIYKRQIIHPQVREHLKWPRILNGRSLCHDMTINSTGLILMSPKDSKCPEGHLGYYGWPKCKPKISTALPHQRFFNFPGIGTITAKDKLALKLRNLAHIPKFKKLILPTFILPAEEDDFRKAHAKSNNSVWISKPTLGSFSRGIRVFRNLVELKNNSYNGSSYVVQKYIENPFTYENLKAQLRLFYIISSINPLRIYSVPRLLHVRPGLSNYSLNEDEFSDRCVHVLDFSIDCKRSYATQYPNLLQDSSQFLLKKLYKTKKLSQVLNSLDELIISLFLTSTYRIMRKRENLVNNRYNSYGFISADVLFDSKLNPFLLEINSYPFTHCGFPQKIHPTFFGDIYAELFNVAGYHFPPNLTEKAQNILKRGLWAKNKVYNSQVSFDDSFYSLNLTSGERKKHWDFKYGEKNESILENLTLDDVRQLIVAEDELGRAEFSKRIFPRADMRIFEKIKMGKRYSYYLKLFEAWETKYENNRRDGRELLTQKYLELISK